MEDVTVTFKGFRSGIEVQSGGIRVWNKAGKSDQWVPLSDLLGVTLKEAKLTRGWLHVRVVGGTPTPSGTTKALSDPWTVVFPMSGPSDELRDFVRRATEWEASRPAPPPQPPFSAPQPVEEVVAPAPPLPMPKKAYGLFTKQVGAEEEIRFVIEGSGGQCLVGLADRCVVVKPGIMAGALGGGRVTTFQYADITGIEINTGMFSAVLEVLSPSYQGTNDRDYWSSGKNSDPFKVSNCLPMNKALLQQHAAGLELLRKLVADAKRPSQPAAPAADLGTQLRDLAELHRSGVLTDTEFALAKAQLLGTRASV